MSRVTQQIIYCLLFFSNTIFGQSDDSVKVNRWLNTITMNAITEPKATETFHNATTGYALYFLQADSLKVPYLVYVPKTYNPIKSYPLVIYLHGGVVSIDSFQYKKPSFAQEPIFDVADKYNTIILYPYGKKNFGWVKQEKAFNNIITIIGEVEKKYNIDKHQIFLGGMSNGASAAFWFITNKPELFKAFYAFSPMPKIYTGDVNYRNITTDKPLYSINAKDDKVYPYSKVVAIYNEHKGEAKGWHFDSLVTGNHGFIYEDSGSVIIDRLFAKLFSNEFLKQQLLRDSLVQELYAIDELDQRYRNQMEEVRLKYGGGTKEMKTLFKLMNEADSVNLIKVKAIIDKYGWLGADIIGSQGNTTLFMVIQHSDLKTQEKYLPIMRQAVNNGKAKASNLALLEDRVAMFEGKKQIYGSQLRWDIKNNTYLIAPIEDPDNVDKRRVAVGLGTLAEYLSNFGLKWNLEQYKKDLPEIEAVFKGMK